MRSTGAVYQCYGKLDDSPINADYLEKKLESDFSDALEKLPDILKEWHFAHNIVNGFPITANTKMQSLQDQNPTFVMGFVSDVTFERAVFRLSESDLEDLLGPAATAEDTQCLDLKEVKEVVDALIQSFGSRLDVSGEIKPVPSEKLIFNNLPHHWISLITQGMTNAPHIRRYFERHSNTQLADVIAQRFQERYQTLKMERSLTSEDIMDRLYEMITGIGTPPTARQVAAHAILAHLFESCDIFEPIAQGGS